MNYELVGIENIDYTNRTGAHITGTRLHFIFENSKINGTGVEVVFCGGSVDVSHLKIGDKCRVLYNRFGKVDNIAVI